MVREHKENKDQLANYSKSKGLEPEFLSKFLNRVSPGDYICLQAYVHPTIEINIEFQKFRKKLLNDYKCATTLGYGPRYLHSTGQLHKGDRGNGIFIQFTSNISPDINIPESAGFPASSMTFGALFSAQALGDEKALLNENRRFIRFHLGDNEIEGLERLM
jgi:hypothetical protein